MGPDDSVRVLDAVRRERDRTADQVESLVRSVACIVEACELTATDDEHDPEGATIAYERAQALALLRQARLDLDRLVDGLTRLESGEGIVCASCDGEIGVERLVVLPTARTCIRCAA